MIDPDRRACSGCERFLPLAQFGKPQSNGAGRTYVPSRCLRCRADYSYLAMRRKQLAAYGITEEDFSRLMEAQGGVCAICGQPEWVTRKDGKIRLLCVDHDHVTGRVRGLLCANCNRAIGLMDDDADRLKKAIYYLTEGSS